jgi:subtilase family serine protease
MFTLNRSPLRRRSPLILEELESRTLLSAAALGNLPTAHQLVLTTAPQADVSITPQGHPNGGGGTPPGYSPTQIQTAYGFNQLYSSGLNGANQTIAIVDAYNDPNIQKDLASFDSKFGLPSANLSVVNQSGGASLPSTSSGWALEISLDVEWAHAMAPGANILLVEANSSNLSDLLTAVNYAGQHASVVSMSWGSGEFSGETSYDSYFTTPGVTYVAASGDNGAPPTWPAVSPNVVAVGGTTLTLNSSNSISSETAWSSSGGGISAYESLPGYQTAAVTNNPNIPGGTPTNRTNPDVSYNANPNTGFAVYDTVRYSGHSGWFEVGGTSAGAPQWSALVAIANEGRALAGLTSLSGGQTLPALYSNASTLHDITSGSNNAYSAGTGYDLVTGLGSPIANLVVNALVSYTSTPGATTTPAATGSSTSSNTAKKSDALGGDPSQSPSSPGSVALIFQVLAASDPTLLIQSAQISTTTLFPFGTASVLSSAFGTNQNLAAVGGISPTQASSSLNAVFGYQLYAPAPKSISSPPENLGNYLSPFRSYSPDAVPTTGADEPAELGGDEPRVPRRTIRISSFLGDIGQKAAPAAPMVKQGEEAPACDPCFVDEASMAFLAEENLADMIGESELLQRLRIPTLALLGVLASSFWMVPDTAEETRKRRVVLV